MKDMRDYLSGRYCGNLIKIKYVDEQDVDDQSEDMEAGAFFEFCISGAPMRNGEFPKARMMASDSKQMYVKFRRAKYNAEIVTAMMDEMGLKIISAQKRFDKGRHVGHIDLVCECTKHIKFEDGTEWNVGDLIVIDLKYSGLIYDRWNKLGWQWSKIQKEYHGTQAIKYNYISNMPFYFWVVQNNNREATDEDGKKLKGKFEMPDMRLFRVPVDEALINEHNAEGNDLMAKFQAEAKYGFTPRPSLAACFDCVVRDTCQDKHMFPHPITVNLRDEVNEF